MKRVHNARRKDTTKRARRERGFLAGAIGAALLATLACGTDVSLGVLATGGGTRAPSVDAARSDASDAGAAGDEGGSDACAPGSCDVIASGLVGARYLAVDDRSVYWAETGHAGTVADPNPVSRVAKAGGAAVVLNSDGGEPRGLRVVGELVVWSRVSGTQATVLRASRTDGSAKTVVGFNAQAGGLAGLDTDGVDVAVGNGTDVRMYPLSGGAIGGTAITVAAQHVVGVALGATEVFIADRIANQVAYVPRSGGLPVALGAVTAPRDLIRDNDILFVATDASLEVRPTLVGSDAGAPTLATDPIVGVASDGGSVYYTTGGALKRLSRGGTGGSTTLASLQGAPGPVVVDGLFAYFVDGTTIRRVAKN